MITPTSASAVQSDIHSQAHASHARDRIRFSAITLCPLLNSRELMELSTPYLAGLHMWSTAHLLYLLRSKFPLGDENLLH
jgi:hypothetical protein